MSKKQINLATTSGIQEISDQAAESLSGGISQSAFQKAAQESNNLSIGSIKSDRGAEIFSTEIPQSTSEKERHYRRSLGESNGFSFL